MLTGHQREILDEALHILVTSNRLLIKGSAGVGKTFLADYLEQRLVTLYGVKPTYITAPTHKALSVLRGKINIDGREHIEFITAHSAMKTKRKIHYKTGAISFEPDFDPKYPPLKGIARMMLDEASMLNTELLDYIEKYATDHNTMVIFLGDEKQINPVGEEVSPVFQRGYPEVELTEIVRQGQGNPIIDLSRNLVWISGKEETLVTTSDSQMGYTYSNDRGRIIKALAEVNGTDELKYLAWTNKEVDNINFLTRKAIYTDPKKIELDETLIFNSPYADTYFTNQEVMVESLGVDTVKLKYLSKNTRAKKVEVSNITLKLYRINIDSGVRVNDALPYGIIVVHEDSQKDFDNLKEFMVTQCKQFLLQWRDYYAFLEQFADVKYNHAITVHKSQGSTYDKSIVNVRNINMNRNKEEKNRLLYTAVTRASDLLILYNV
tara:strand:+ start:10328 stop:11635 length:1308 start_codon:yes stop_codon:yes gene_type:complete